MTIGIGDLRVVFKTLSKFRIKMTYSLDKQKRSIYRITNLSVLRDNSSSSASTEFEKDLISWDTKDMFNNRKPYINNYT